MHETIQKKTACTRDCPDACSLIATIEGDRVVRLQGDPDHPVTKGFICQRTSRFLDRQYSPDRLTRPLLRRAKGQDFEEISIDEAIDVVADRMQTYRSESGGASILQHRCGGSLGIMKNVGDHFFDLLGPVTVKSGDVCAGAGEAAQLADFGRFESSDFFDLRHSKTIFLWGKNVFVSNIHLIPELKKARAAGTRIALIDPVHQKTETIADSYTQPRPGTDAAIALGIARWLFENDQVDPQASEYCDHFDAFRQLALSHSLNQYAQIADITPQQLESLAIAYADGPTCSLIGWGLQRRRFGAATIRVIDALAAISGNLGIPGGGASFYFGRRDAFDFSFSDPQLQRRSIPEPLLGRGILDASDPPIRMVYIWGSNPVVMLPDSETIAEALRTREFTVVVDPFLTDSAKCADLVIPTTTFLEEDDLIGSYGHHFLGNVRPLLTPSAGVLSDHEIFRRLARRLSLDASFDVDASVWKNRLLRRVRAAERFDDQQFQQSGFAKNPLVDDVLFADRKFATESGKVNLIRELPEGMLSPALTGLRLTAVSTRKSQASQWPSETQIGPAQATVNPKAVPGANNGDVVTLTTQRSSIDVKLRFDKHQRTDILLMEKGGWHSAGRSANALIHGELSDDGECAAYYDTQVIVERNDNA